MKPSSASLQHAVGNCAAGDGVRRTRADVKCKAPAMSNGRCRMHGGKSTGPRTSEGLERMRRANTRHENYFEEKAAS
jgi:hypothetical protein